MPNDASEPSSLTAPVQQRSGAEELLGVLLYYQYTNLKDSHELQSLATWFTNTSTALQLCGRVRIARDGINVTLGGRMVALREHMLLLKGLERFQHLPVDFKLAPSGGPLSSRVQEETGFTGLHVRICKELVSLGPLAEGRADPTLNTAPHLSPQEFHQRLQQASRQQQQLQQQDQGHHQEPRLGEGGGVVLLDARNVYETRIGRFDVAGVPLLDPHTRCFSDLPVWMEHHKAHLAHKQVYMYCTGGVRCERASAYLRELGPEFQQVFQLQGGIQRYLEAFPEGGFFRGKNFVYDDRVAVGPELTAAPPGSPAHQHHSPGSPARSMPPSPPAPPGAGGAPASPAPGTAAHGPGSSPGRPPPAEQLLAPGDGAAGGTLAVPQPYDVSSPAMPAPAVAALGAPKSEQPPALDGHGPAGCPDASPAAVVVGQCAACGRPWDDYTARARCHRCRLLLLLCPSCALPASPGHSSPEPVPSTLQPAAPTPNSSEEGALSPPQALGAGAPPPPGLVPEARAAQGAGALVSDAAASPLQLPLLCELCVEREQRQPWAPHAPPLPQQSLQVRQRASVHGLPVGAPGAFGAWPGSVGGGSGSGGAGGARRLSILCLHGFRQTASSFQARCRAFLGKLALVADLHLLDAPHLLPLYLKPACEHGTQGRGRCGAQHQAGQRGGPPQVLDGQQRTVPPRAGPQDSSHGDGLGEGPGGCPGPCGPPWGGVARAEPSACGKPWGGFRAGMEAPASARRRAWMVSPDVLAWQPRLAQERVWEVAPPWVGADQHLQQTEGWPGALQAVMDTVERHGPFDGVLGFSQGASAAALLCAQQQLDQDRLATEVAAGGPGPGAALPPGWPAAPWFRFAVLASGYVPPGSEAAELLRQAGALRVPSLHIFSAGADGQGAGDMTVGAEHSRALAELFQSSLRTVHCHAAGHTLPGSTPTLGAVTRWLAAQQEDAQRA